MENVVTAAVVIIGNEILSGRTQDKNINYIALKLGEIGIRLREVRIIPDVEAVIVDTVNTLRHSYNYVFTCGGIGPTHDDITSECIARAFGVEYEVNPEAFMILEKHYPVGEFTPARQKMAMLPRGAGLVLNPVSAAPGFVMENVYVMAGVPRIMQAMMDNIAVTLKGGDIVHSRTVSTSLPESKIAEGLAVIQSEYEDVDIGSYPYFKDGNLGVSVVLRGTVEARLDSASDQVEALFQKLMTA